jgi:hypothetical protein
MEAAALILIDLFALAILATLHVRQERRCRTRQRLENLAAAQTDPENEQATSEPTTLH